MSVPQLRGANALLTGGSQGLGPLIARALAERGVNVALAARSTEKLAAVAGQLAPLGVKVAALPADVTSAPDRDRLVRAAEAALGPLDLLINNAGVELNSAFARMAPATIEQVLDTNVAAAMQLTRLVLPGLLERRRGHIVNMASLAGKLGTPYGSVYGASKAALMAWSFGLRAELAGTGVSASWVAPGLTTDAGMFAYHQARPHPLLGEVKPAAVVRAVLRVLERDVAEVTVYTPLFKSYQLLNVLSPDLLIWMQRVLGVNAWLKRTYDRQ